MRRDILLVFAISLSGLLSLYASDFGVLSRPFILAFQSYLFLLLVIGSILLRSVRRGSIAVFSSLMTVSFLSLIHLLSFPAYDALAPVAYLAVLLLSFLLNSYMLFEHYIQKRPLFKVYEEAKLTITLIIVSTIIGGLLIASRPLMEQFGLLTLVGAALSYLIMVFFLSPFIRMEKNFHLLEDLSESERRVKGFVKRYGKGKKLHAFYASWLGSAVAAIDEYIDKLEAKGHLGHNFFSYHNFLLWFSTTLSFSIGIVSAGGSIVASLIPFALIIGGLVMLGPQAFIKRPVRRLVGLFFTISGMLSLYFWGMTAMQFGMGTILLALIAIYFAYKDDEIISMVFASFFAGSLFVLGYALWRPPVVLVSTPWLITTAVFVLLLHEYYVDHARR